MDACEMTLTIAGRRGEALAPQGATATRAGGQSRQSSRKRKATAFEEGRARPRWRAGTGLRSAEGGQVPGGPALVRPWGGAGGGPCSAPRPRPGRVFTVGARVANGCARPGATERGAAAGGARRGRPWAAAVARQALRRPQAGSRAASGRSEGPRERAARAGSCAPRGKPGAHRTP